ncbi:MAG: hypothetical protein HGB28_05955 [Oscillochloris sp.]|nr:hypothetical protein [Oscillochloris sp.]
MSPPHRLSAIGYRLSAILFLLALVACAAPSDGSASNSAGGVGRSSPEAAVDGFLEDLNSALRDPSLADAAAQQSWAERLAGYFAPDERLDQRVAFSDMLAGFVDTAQNPVVGSKATLEITYSRLELLSRDGDEALVRVVDGSFALRWLDAQGDVVRERTGGLTEVIGQQSGGIPVLQVDGLWFLTER